MCSFARRAIGAIKKRWVLDTAALGSMVLALIGASKLASWEWWPFAVLASMFFVAANLHLLRSFSIGPGGIKGETRDITQGPIVDTKETWKERDQLELYALANLSVGNDPNVLPINRDPALSRFRLLKDAAKDGQLQYQGDNPNAFATVRLSDFVEFAQKGNIDAFKKLADKWMAAHPNVPALDVTPTPKPAEESPQLRLARLRTSGVVLRNRVPQHNEIDSWLSNFEDWHQSVTNEIRNIEPADAEWFVTLDTVPPPRVNLPMIMIPEYLKAFRELDFMLVKLERLLVKYSKLES